MQTISRRRLDIGAGNVRPQDNEARLDWIGPVCMLILAITGVFFIYSATSFGEPSGLIHEFWFKQVTFILLGAGVYTAIALIDYKVWLENSHYIYFLAIVPLLMVIGSKLGLPLGGVERYGSWRWIDLKIMLYQPSEGVKIAVLIMASSILARSEIGDLRDSVMTLVKVFVAILLPILLIFLQPDLGSSLVFPPMIFSLLYVSRLSERFFAAVFAVFLLLTAILSADLFNYYNFLDANDLSANKDTGKYEQVSWVPLKDYQRNRIMSLVAPEAVDPDGIGVSWNLRQSLIATGTGGLLGKGHGEGTQAKLGYLPQTVAHNDFIFSVLAEEKGFLGGLFVIGMYTILTANGIRIASVARDRFGMLLAVGVSVIFMVHIFVNIGMTIGLMPITGLPLPFLSYGGSFLLSCCILQGLLQSVYRYRKAYA